MAEGALEGQRETTDNLGDGYGRLKPLHECGPMSYHHPRQKRHNPVEPLEGDGSCWITPDGYIPLRFECHSECLEDEGIADYDTAFEMGWIRVGVFCGEDAFSATIEFQSKCVDHRSLVFLSRILGKLIVIDSALIIEDNSYQWPDNQTMGPVAVRTLVKRLMSRAA